MLCHHGKFHFFWISEQVLAWRMNEFILWSKTLPSLVNNLWWDIVMDGWNLDEKPLSKWQYLPHLKSIISIPFFLNKVWKIMLNYLFKTINHMRSRCIKWFRMCLLVMARLSDTRLVEVALSSWCCLLGYLEGGWFLWCCRKLIVYKIILVATW